MQRYLSRLTSRMTQCRLPWQMKTWLCRNKGPAALESGTQMKNARRKAARYCLTWRAQLRGVNPSSTPRANPLVSTDTFPISTNFTASVRGALFASSETVCFSIDLSIIIGRLTSDGHYVSCVSDRARLCSLCQELRRVSH